MSEQSETPHTAPDTITLSESFHEDLRSKFADVKLSVRRSGRGGPHIEQVCDTLGVDDDHLSVESLAQHGDTEPLGCIIVGGLLVSAIGATLAFAVTLSILWTAVITLLFIGGMVALCIWSTRPASTTHVSVRCDGVDDLHDLLARVERDKNLHLTSLQWRYDIEEQTRLDWAAICIARARARAENIAEALGVRVIGVYSYREVFELPQRSYEQPYEFREACQASMRKKITTPGPSSTPQPPMLPMVGAERSGVGVVIAFKVEPNE